MRTCLYASLIFLFQVSISSAFWLLNRTGLPLLFRQEGVSHEAAGQQVEHEKASTTTPLLFAYSEGEFVEKYRFILLCL